MSALYPDLDLTNFPNSSDQRYIMIDPSTNADMSAINSYNTFISNGNMSAAISVLENNPRLQRMLFNAEKWNRHEDMLIAMERFYESDVQKYLVNIVVYRGNWNAGTTYSKYNVVYGSNWQAYMAVRDVPAGTALTNTQYFIPLTLKGDTGVSGMGLSYRGAWASSETYYANDCVVYSNGIWACKVQNANKSPTTANSAYWESVFDVDDVIASMRFFTSHMVDLTIKSSDWTSKKYTYTNSEITTDTRVEVEPIRFSGDVDNQNYDAIANADIHIEQSAGKLVFTVRGTQPTVSTYVRVIISGRDSLAADSVKDDVALAQRYANSAKESADSAAASASKASGHTHTQSQIEGLTDVLAKKSNTGHTHSASSIAGGTFTGRVNANSTATAALGFAQIRNIIISTTEPTGNVSDGDIWLRYTES